LEDPHASDPNENGLHDNFALTKHVEAIENSQQSHCYIHVHGSTESFAVFGLWVNYFPQNDVLLMTHRVLGYRSFYHHQYTRSAPFRIQQHFLAVLTLAMSFLPYHTASYRGEGMISIEHLHFPCVDLNVDVYVVDTGATCTKHQLNGIAVLLRSASQWGFDVVYCCIVPHWNILSFYYYSRCSFLAMIGKNHCMKPRYRY
jgi:hypothetical protein